MLITVIISDKVGWNKCVKNNKKESKMSLNPN